MNVTMFGSNSKQDTPDILVEESPEAPEAEIIEEEEEEEDRRPQRREQAIPNWRHSELLNPHMGGGYEEQDYGGGYSGPPFNPGNDVMFLRQENEIIKQAIAVLERDRDNLRTAIRKLKVENSRFKTKMKRMADALRKGGVAAGVDMDEMDGMDADGDFDEIGEFILIGGPKDPFSLRYEVPVKDATGLEHQSSERYLWYKMAETFGDMEAGEKIRLAVTGAKAEEEMQKIKDFDEAKWNPVKLQIWEDAQKLKFDQVNWIKNLLVYTDKLYIAVASQDKMWGTGWRKQRQEAERPKMWDGENQGGKVLMKIRDSYKTTHVWSGPYDEQETEKKYNSLRKEVWRRVPPRQGVPRVIPRPIGRIGLVGQTGQRPIPMGLGNQSGWKRVRRY